MLKLIVEYPETGAVSQEIQINDSDYTPRKLCKRIRERGFLSGKYTGNLVIEMDETCGVIMRKSSLKPILTFRRIAE